MEKTTQNCSMKKSTLISLVFNIAYCVYHIAYGATTNSWWLLAIGIYYAILSIVRFAVLRYKGKRQLLLQFTGVMLIALSSSLVGTVILAFIKDRGTVFPLITMLAIATYTFTKITLATIKWIKAREKGPAENFV